MHFAIVVALDMVYLYICVVPRVSIKQEATYMHEEDCQLMISVVGLAVALSGTDRRHLGLDLHLPTHVVGLRHEHLEDRIGLSRSPIVGSHRRRKHRRSTTRSRHIQRRSDDSLLPLLLLVLLWPLLRVGLLHLKHRPTNRDATWHL